MAIYLMNIILGPDFPTGGQILGRNGIRETYISGRGSITMRGVAEIEIDKNKKNLGRGENIFVARTITHRIKNISVVEPLEIIEVQTGDYLGEDDIERLEDDYGRI